METIRKINDTLAIAGQISLDQVLALAEDGFQAVLNVRSPDEAGVLPDEASKVEAVGLVYANCPVTMESLTEDNIMPTFRQINDLPKPLLVHCDTGLRAALIVLIHITMLQGATPKQALLQASQLGLITPLSLTLT